MGPRLSPGRMSRLRSFWDRGRQGSDGKSALDTAVSIGVRAECGAASWATLWRPTTAAHPGWRVCPQVGEPILGSWTLCVGHIQNPRDSSRIRAPGFQESSQGSSLGPLGSMDSMLWHVGIMEHVASIGERAECGAATCATVWRPTTATRVWVAGVPGSAAPLTVVVQALCVGQATHQI